MPASAFTATAANQVNIEQQYDIFVFPVTDHASAQQAIDLIAKQGEGIGASPTYQSHYRRFYDILQEWQTHGSFDAAWNLMCDPTSEGIALESTRELSDLFDDAYEILLILLTGLYATVNQQPTSYPYRATALGQEAFAPFMTMVIRSLAEVLVQIKADEHGTRAGPGFTISAELAPALLEPYTDSPAPGMAGQTLKPIFADIDGIIARMESFSNRLGLFLKNADPLPAVDRQLEGWASARLRFIHSNSKRIAVNLRRIYQQNIYSVFQAGGYCSF